MREEIRKIQALMEAADYVTDAPVATSVHLAMTLRKPLLIEGHAGVGKTEVAKVMARMLGTNLIRLQCYEGLDASTALYEWNYQKQLLHIRLSEGSDGRSVGERQHEIFSEAFLLRRPLLQAISQADRAPVLLVDEVDRCVTGPTLVRTASGPRRAEDIVAGDEVVSFNPRAFATTYSKVKKVLARGTAPVLRVVVGGRVLEVTPDHRFLRYTDAGPEIVAAAELRPGDRLPLHKSRPVTETAEPEFEFADRILKLTPAGRTLLRDAYVRSGQTYAQLARAAGISRGHLRNVLQPRPCRDSLRAVALERLAGLLGIEGRLQHGLHVLGLRVEQSLECYEILGYIVADGAFTSDRLCISDKDRATLEAYARKFESAFGCRPRILPGPHRNFELTYHSLPLGRFLRRVLGRGLLQSRAREVPGWAFALPADKRAGFVRGYFDGEGWVGDHQVSAVSSSPYLLVGMQHLLGSLGVDSHISIIRAHPDSFGHGTYYQLAVSDTAAFAARIGFCAPAKSSLLGTPRPLAYRRTETLPAEPVLGALTRLRQGTVLGQTRHHQTVYDVMAGRVRPNVSSLRRVAEAFNEQELRDLVDRGVVLAEVTRVEPGSGARPVFDLVLDGEPYFVANEVVTHNCDEEFEAFMLEVFAEWQVTIPEIGTIRATHPPHVILTSNRTRELSDALRRRCLYLWIDYPDFAKEVQIVERKVPGISGRLAHEITRFMEALRRVRLGKVPGVAETLDWAQALAALHADHLDETLVNETLGCVLKDADDIRRFRTEIARSGLAPFLPAQT